MPRPGSGLWSILLLIYWQGGNYAILNVSCGLPSARRVWSLDAVNTSPPRHTSLWPVVWAAVRNSIKPEL